ncbi:YdbH domain-containing protein [Pseudoalteromonas sp. C2R02]|uniref:intermembrane phospholipid transport protein YdbH family protein n=1 Tax=Pseudoalteromonas sp. C2R02 TaxID=2841565 RepID=UPI001C09E993|nr:YdbH domain-containing protein [Pseudoalteromonas sp. C2R02]MBU2972346.1 YdbH domain-containing protein [Pseudoalteromonas sp. C2R02]
MLHFVKPYLAPYNIAVSCFEVKLASNLDVMIDKLCLNHALFDVNLSHGKIDWSYQEGIKFKGINLNSVDVQSLKPIEFKKSEAASNPLVELHSFFKKLSDFNLPFTININEFTYKTFNSKLVYTGSFVAADNDYKIHLLTPSKTKALHGSLNIINNEIDGKITLNVQPSIEFLSAHGFTLPAEIQKYLNVKGTVSSHFNWKKNLLTIKQQTESIVVDSEVGILNSGPFRLKHDTVWQGVIGENDIDLVFAPQSTASLSFEHNVVIALLKGAQVPEYLTDLLSNNKKELIAINPQGSFKVDFEQQIIDLDTIKLKISNNEQSSLIKLEGLSTSLNFDRLNTKFDVNAELNISNEIAKDAANIEMLGQLNKSEGGFFIDFYPASNIILKNLRAESVYIPQIKTELKGKIEYAFTTGLSLALNLETMVLNGALKNIIKTEQLVIRSQLDGTLENMKVAGTLVLDDINLANYAIQGDINKPYINISMEQLSIPSLLELNIAHKPDLALINGTIDYQLKGQLTDIKDVFKNELNLQFNVKDVIGEVNGFWLEGLYWQQNFELKNQKITTYDIANNISLGSLDSGTPISELLATSSINFESNKLNINLLDVKADAFGGSFKIPELKWPLDANNPVTLKLEQIDLNKIIELEKQQGIIVTGRVSGNLPLFIDEYIRIENGKLFNVGEGVIQIKDNPGVESLKQTSTELALAFDALENVHYHQLNADVFMYDDGRMLLDTVIKGRNPDLDNEVNLNLNINYDLLGLIKSLRIADNMESEIIQKLQQKD